MVNLHLSFLSTCMLLWASFSIMPSLEGAQKNLHIGTSYRGIAEKLITAALADSFAYNRLAELTDSFGPRFSGTKNLEDAID
ncbi:uncharacterized protein METZ01_LOCUS268862, partial [marine metagenome]